MPLTTEAHLATRIIPGVRQDHLGQLYRIGVTEAGAQVIVPYQPSYRFELRGVSLLEGSLHYVRINADGTEARVK